MIIQHASWIRMKNAASTVVPVFRKAFRCLRPIQKAVLEVTCAGVYEATLNGGRVGEFILAPGFARVRIEPHPDERLGSLSATLDTVHGRIRSSWKYVEHGIRYEIEVPVEAEIVVGGECRIVGKGKYIFGE